MNLNKLRDPFVGIADNIKLTQNQKFERAVRVYEREKRKALRLYGTYSIIKINWLMGRLIKTQNQILCQTKL